MKSKKSTARYNRKHVSLRLRYETLEPRHLLAVASGLEPGWVARTPPAATSKPALDIQLNSMTDVTPGSDLISNLAIKLPVEQRNELLREYLNMGPFDAMWLTSLRRDQLGTAQLKYQQHHHGFAVEGGEYTIHVKDREVFRLSGNYVDVGTPAFTAKLTEAQALDHALKFVGAETYMWESAAVEGLELGHFHEGHDHAVGHDVHDHEDHDHHHEDHDHESGFTSRPSAERVFVADGDAGAVLTYKFDIYAAEPLSRNYVFVDAQTGEIVAVQNRIHEADVPASGTSLYDGTVNFVADSFTGGYRLRQAVNGVETFDLNNGTSYSAATDIVSATTSFTATDVQTGVQAHFGAEQTLEYFSSQHGRDSYDDAGTTLLSYVSYSTNYVNAFWDGSRMTYGDGNGTTYNPLVSLDIVGHEITHGVTQFSAGLVYAYESGALNESFSDIFGEAIENFATGTNDWLMGEDIGVGSGRALRSMSDPPAKGDPDTYLGTNWYAGSGDNGGVHTNSGVQNKWFYILSEGEAGVNDHGQSYDVTGIGIADAGEIAYRNLSVYLTSSSQFIDAREGAIQSAIDLFGVDSQQHLSTIAAWDAVGVGGSLIDLSVVAVDGLGSSVYQGSVTDIVIGAGLVDTISVDLDPNQTLSLAIAGTNGLVPNIEVYDPGGTLIGSGTATGSELVIQNIGIDFTPGGTYQILVSGDAGSSGPYQLDVLLNASFENESHGGTHNNSLVDAEDIGGSSMSVGSDGSIDRLAVVSNLAADQFFVDGEDFETGSLGSSWVTASSDPDGRIVVTSSFAAAGSGYSLFMDQTSNGTFNLNEAIWTVDLSGIATPNLRFYHAEWGDETHVLPASFAGSFDGDGVAISADGTNWFTVLTDTNFPDGQWNEVTVDLAAAAASAGIALGANFKIKFQQYDNFSYNTDGRAYDQISITTPQDSPDWYSFVIGAGQAVALATTGFGIAGASQVDLRDSSGALLASGVAGTNVDSYVSRYTNSGTTGTFYAVVTGTQGLDYSLVVTRGADFDLEPNDTGGQNISDNGGVFGFVTTYGLVAAEPDTFAAESVIDTAFPGVTLSENVGSGNIFAAAAGYGAPTGANVFAPGATAANGFRGGDAELRADFAIPQTFVLIDVGSDDASDLAWLRAYDSSGTLLEEVISGSVAAGGSETLSISRPTADIAYVIAAGLGGDITPLDNLVYQVLDPNDDRFIIAAVENDQFSFDAFLPGVGPYLFNNPLDNPAGSALRMELRDPDGVLLAADAESISVTALKTGNYELRVYAESAQGEYFVEHWYNHAPEAVLDTESTDEDNLLNIDVLLNDSDVDNDTYFVVDVTTPAHGTAVIKSDGTIDYKPTDDYFGSDSFDYTLEDEHGAISTGTVNITVNPINDAPTDITLSANSVAENTDTSGGPLEIGTLTASDIDSASFTYSLISGTGDTDNGSFEIDGDKLRVKQGVELDFENQSKYSVRIEVSDGDLTYEKEFQINVTNQLEIEGLTIDNDTVQRSMIRQLVIRFDEIVTYSAGAFSLIQRGSGDAVVLGDSFSNATGKTVVTLTFTGSLVTNGSLNDGNYQLTIDGSLIQSAATGQLLDGDEDGSEGGIYLFGDQEEDKFFRFFSDSDGDRDVDNVDLAKFLQTYRASLGDPNFNSSLDYDNDGDVDNIDLSRFLMRYFKTLPFG